MLSELVKKTSIYLLLYKIDQDLAMQYRAIGCPVCGGVLHQANYERKPRGGPPDLTDELCIRQSLCCSGEGCRRRVLPPSTLFMDRRVYWQMVILIVLTLRQNRLEGRSTQDLIRRFGISRKTLFRWIAYYRDIFPSSDKWKAIRGKVGILVRNSHLPGDLLDYFIGHKEDYEEGVIGCLQFLSI